MKGRAGTEDELDLENYEFGVLIEHIKNKPVEVSTERDTFFNREDAATKKATSPINIEYLYSTESGDRLADAAG